jgi:hypothetical protein
MTQDETPAFPCLKQSFLVPEDIPKEWHDDMQHEGQPWLKKHLSTIIHALKLVEKLTGEPSEGMLIACDASLDMPEFAMTIIDAEQHRNAFKAMIAQAQKEIEDGK